MGMSTHVVGIREIDGGKFEKMAKVKQSCEEAGIDYPKEVVDYFGQADDFDATCNIDDLREALQQVELPESVLKEYSNEYSSGYEVNVADLDDEIIAVRFYNSW